MLFQFKDSGDVTKGFVGEGLWGNILNGKQNMEKAKQLMDAYNESVHTGSLDLEQFYKDQKITNQTLKDSFASLNGGIGTIDDIKGALGGVSIKAKAAEIGIKAFRAALDFGVTLLITTVITKLVEHLQWVSESTQRAIDSAKELSNQFNESMSSINDNMTTLQGLNSEFDTLSSGVDKYGNNVALTSDEYARYKEIINQILNISPSLIQGYDAEGNALANNNNILREAIELQKEKMRQQAEEQTYIKNLQTLQDGYAAKVKQDQDNLNNQTRDMVRVLRESKSAVSELYQMSTTDQFSWLKKYTKLGNNGEGAGLINPSLWTDDNLQEFQSHAQEIYQAMLQNTDSFIKSDTEKMQSYVEQIGALQNQASDEKSALVQALQRIPQSLDGVLLNTNAATMFSNIVNSISDVVLSSGNIAQIKNGLISLTQSLANDPELQKQVSQLFTLDPSSMPAQDYQNQANALLQNLMSAFAAAGVQVDESKFRVLLGLDVATGVDLNSAKDKIAKTLGIAAKDLSDVSLPQIQALYKNLDELNGVSLEDAITQIESLGDASDMTFGSIMDLSDKTINEFNSSINSLQSAIKDFNENQGFTVDNLQTLLFLGDEYVSLLDIENGQVKISKDAYNALAESKFDTLKANLILKASNLIDTFTSEAIAAQYLTQQTTNLKNATIEANMAQLAMSYSMAQSKGGNIAEASNKVVKTLSNYMSIIDSLKTGIDGVGDANKRAKTAISNMTTALEHQKQALSDQKSVMEDDRKNIESLIDKVMDMLKQRYDDEQTEIEKTSKALDKKHDKEMDALEAEKDVMLDKVQSELDLLDVKEDEYKYEKDLADKNKSLALLQSQYAALELDDSEATQKRKNELLDEIANKQSEIDDYQHDHSIDLQKDMLDSEKDKLDKSYQNKIDTADAAYEKQKDIYDKQLSDIKEYTSKEVNIRKEAVALINKGGQQLYNDLIVYNRNYGNMVDADIKKLWNDAYVSIRKYQSGHYDVLAILNQIQNATVGLQNKIDALTPKINAAKAATDALKGATNGVSGSVGALNNEYTKLLNTLNKVNKSHPSINNWVDYAYNMGFANPMLFVKSMGYSDIGSFLKSADYHKLEQKIQSGKFASGSTYVPKTGVYNVDEQGEELILNKPASGRYITISKGSGVMTAQDTKNMMNWLTNPQALIRSQLKQMNLHNAANMIQNIGGTEMTFRGGDVYISGMTSDDAIRKFKQIQQETVEEVFDKMAKIGERTGVKPNVMNKIF